MNQAHCPITTSTKEISMNQAQSPITTSTKEIPMSTSDVNTNPNNDPFDVPATGATKIHAGETTMTNNPNPTTGDLMAEVDEFQAMQAKKKELLGALLSEHLNDDATVFVTTGKMGRSTKYVGSARLGWIGNNIKLFTQMPLFKNKIDKKRGTFIIDHATAADLRQRAPDWSRQQILVNYLLRHPTRQFPAILVIVEEPWVNELDAPEWEDDENGEKRATRTSMPFEPLDPDGKVGLLRIAGINAYVIDGSHRLLGIRGVQELLVEGYLTLKRKGGEATKKTAELDDLLREFGVMHADVASLLEEKMSVEFIPAVLKGETREEARIRVRSVFVHVNKSAEPPTLSEQALLDEDDGYAVVARDGALSHRLFRDKVEGDRINWKSTALPEGSRWFTTGKTLRDAVEVYFQSHPIYSKWATESSKEIAVRPSEEEVEAGIDNWNEFLDHLAALPSFAAILAGGSLDEWRSFATKDDPNNRGHLLMRPVGQLILAEAIGNLHLDVNGPHEDLDDLFKLLAKYDASGGFENVSSASSHWWGITYNPQGGKMIVTMSSRRVAVKLLQHLLNDPDLTKDDREELLQSLEDARTIETGEGEMVTRDWDGTEIKKGQLKLPQMI
jgi:hypothetical protein